MEAHPAPECAMDALLEMIKKADLAFNRRHAIRFRQTLIFAVAHSVIEELKDTMDTSRSPNRQRRSAEELSYSWSCIGTFHDSGSYHIILNFSTVLILAVYCVVMAQMASIFKRGLVLRCGDRSCLKSAQNAFRQRSSPTLLSMGSEHGQSSVIDFLMK
ncbi:hypothetical protein QR680_007109 [Steinernema hermaphroditum]|uniref:Uncharacterized protein n=1 Tax=Steinernema hermaphroditum TaxID=289476 RepID=A0AA39HYV3_9BILA|nr:hypothetical protein QR680_007109 [Steinernema hermaphroditum]